jgi:hypothetical protein
MSGDDVQNGLFFEGFASVEVVATIGGETTFAPLAEASDDGATLSLANEVHLGVVAVAGDGVVRLSFRMICGAAAAVSLGVRLTLSGIGHHVVLPAGAYNGNRLDPRGSGRGADQDASGPDAEPLQTRVVPRLEIGGGGRIEQRAGDLAMPCVGVFDRDVGTGRWIGTAQRAEGLPPDPRLDTLLVVEERDGQTFIEVTAAGRRHKPHRVGGPLGPGATLATGDVVTLTFRHARFACASPAELHRAMFDRRPLLADQPRPISRTPLLPPESVPLSACWATQERKFNEQSWVAAHGYYSVGMREVPSQDWQTGWVGGCNTHYALLADGDAVTRQRAVGVFDFLATGATASGYVRTGFFEGQWRPSDRLFQRHEADALFFLCKMVRLQHDRGHEVPDAWLTLVARLADAFCKTFERHGQFGQYVHEETGEILRGGTCAAGLAPAALLLAADALDEPRYRRVAVESARHFADDYTAIAFTNGGPGDIAQAHDSESAFALVESYAALLETEGDDWREPAIDAACQAASYVMPYDFDFPEDSQFGRLGMRTTGTVFANVQNKHSAPGICTLSGLGLLRIARATGDRRWLDLLATIARGIGPYMSRLDRPIVDIRPGQRWPVLPAGWVNERINTSDWEVRGDPAQEIDVGEVFGGSTWSETALLLTRTELPGVYVDKGRAWCVALDHVRPRVDDGRLLMENPTPFDARVKVMAENDPSVPLPTNGLAGQASVEVPAHGKCVCEIT